MGHSSKKSIQSSPVNQGLDMSALGQIMQNIDVSAMANMLNKVDMNQVMSMLSNVTPQPSKTEGESSDEKREVKSEGDIPSPETLRIAEAITPSPVPVNPTLPPNDPIVIVLNSIKPFLPPDKCKVIDDMVTLLGIKVVIDSIFPSRATK